MKTSPEVLAKKREYYLANKERIAAVNKARYDLKRDEILAQKKEYTQNNKEVIVARRKAHYEKNKEEIQRKLKEYRDANPEKYRASMEKYYEKNKDKVRQHSKEYAQRNKERRRAYMQEWHKKNGQTPERKAANLARGRAYESRNREKRSKRGTPYKNARRARDPHYAMVDNMRSRLCIAIRKAKVKKSDRFFKLTGCTYNELIVHIESKFVDGMCWERRSEIHVDHVRPVSSFDLSDPEQQRACFHYTNLQPLWAKDNLRKSDQYFPTLTE